MEPNIQKIAARIIKEMKEQNIDINDFEFYIQDTFEYVPGKEPSSIRLSKEQLREYIEEHCKE